MRARTLVALAALALTSFANAAERKTKNIIFVMTDGLRWQEVFNGADPALMNKENGAVTNVDALRKAYWREDVQERRQALMPFVWSVLAKNGQLFGNRGLSSDAYVTNTMFFSYPGYNETLSGFADDARISTNDKNPNPNVTVLEWLHRKPAYKGKVAAFAAWDTFGAIFNSARAGFPVNAGYDPLEIAPVSDRMKLLNRLKVETHAWDAEPYDSFTFHTALEYLKQHKPRVLFLSLGETDEWSHEGKYAEYLRSANRVDRYLRELWDTLQSMPQYRGTTTLIFSPDHGRGEAPVQWKSHGQKVPDSKFIWMAFLGPDTRALGERSKTASVTQSQIAATLAALLGEDYIADVPKAGKPVVDVLPN